MPMLNLYTLISGWYLLDINRRSRYKVSCEGSIVEGVEPRPTDAALVVIGKDPLEALEVALPDVFDELLYVLLIHVKLFAVISHLPALLT